MGRRKAGRSKATLVYLDDQRGSACHLYNICRDVLWGMVERTTQDHEEYVVDEPEIDNSIEEMQLPISFGGKKRKRKEKQRRNSKGLALPVLLRNNIIPEHNIMKVKYDSIPNLQIDNQEEEWIYVKVQGIGPSLPAGSHCMIRVLNQLAFHECPRNLLYQLSYKEQANVYDNWESDFYFCMSQYKPEDVHEKYWDQRYRIFHRFDRGLKLDAESWYSITYEVLAQYMLQRVLQVAGTMGMMMNLVLDCFSGCGGCSIAFAQSPSLHVVAVDIDAHKLQYLRYVYMLSSLRLLIYLFHV
jgi:hypothetical protein